MPFFPKRWKRYEAALGHWYHFKPSQRPTEGLTAEPEGTSCRGLLGGSRCLVKTPGGLATSCSHATSTKPRQRKSKQMGPAERWEIEHLLSEQSSSAPPLRRLGPFCQGYRLWFQPLCSCVPVFLLYLPSLCLSFSEPAACSSAMFPL